jgi:ATP phosphoribosyltransferase
MSSSANFSNLPKNATSVTNAVNATAGANSSSATSPSTSRSTPPAAAADTPTTTLKLALPKGRMQDKVFKLMSDAGMEVRPGARAYRPQIALPGLDVKVLKPQNVVEMLHAGSRDVGFAGADWVRELSADLVELLDTRFNPVRMVAAAPPTVLEGNRLPNRPLVIASEYEAITTKWIRDEKINAQFVRSYGATEVFPPEDADCIVDIAQSGETLRANNLTVFAELMTSSTRLYASPGAMKDPAKRAAIDRLVLLVTSVLEARRRVMLEINVSPEALDAVVAILPCMRGPTISQLHGNAGYALKAAVPRDRLPLLIPEIKARGGTDIVAIETSQIIP